MYNLIHFSLSNIDSYIKVYMLYRGQRVDKRQTRIVEQSRDPVYDQTFEFNLLGLLQLSQPQDNMGFEASGEDAAEREARASGTAISAKTASRIQFALLVMDSDQMEKNDVIGKIDLNTQHHQKRLFATQQQMQSNSSHTSNNHNASYMFNKKEATIHESSAENGEAEEASGPASGLFKNNWFDIFYKPNFPVVCTFQINSYC
jgi:Ca2+-dependent lipid-binding protein